MKSGLLALAAIGTTLAFAAPAMAHDTKGHRSDSRYEQSHKDGKSHSHHAKKQDHKNDHAKQHKREARKDHRRDDRRDVRKWERHDNRYRHYGHNQGGHHHKRGYYTRHQTQYSYKPAPRRSLLGPDILIVID